MLASLFPDFYTKSHYANGKNTRRHLTDSHYSSWLFSLPFVLLGFVLGIISAAALLRRFINRQFQNIDELDFFMGASRPKSDRTDGLSQANSLKYQKHKYEVPRSSFKIG